MKDTRMRLPIVNDHDLEGKAFLKGAAVGVIFGFMLALLILALVY